MASYETSTHVFKTADGLSLEVDILKPSTAQKDSVVLLHFHGGFLAIGEKTTFPPHWLINACHHRGWIYATASYRLLPEAKGLDILQDTLDATNWINQNISSKIILAGSSAGGYLALATAAHPSCPRPIAVLAIYGMLDPASERYIQPGQPLMGPVENESEALGEIDAAMQSGQVLDGYAFPASPPTDQRIKWIRTLHQTARYADVLTRCPGLAQRIAEEGTSAIPEEYRSLFPVSFGLTSSFPPTVLLHGDRDGLVEFDQSSMVAEKLRTLGVDLWFENAVDQDHGFETKEVINLDAGDSVDGDAVNESLRSVISVLEKHVSSI
ncbi:uncharacterized protein N7511_002102 [Penicillium nucicola]|uniref:uncharacterized protein n=1 Tax=Penicillium nucicola TaxID=1850975 RepID=UPI002545069C|nr:uncharacterized protein N7511_002102 [Penicillium nucicola]KAJ5770051.1 hypothetical protein N7511_002102 [Penicillium nucicola]